MGAFNEFLKSPRRTDAELAADMDEVRRTAVRVEGQHASDTIVQQERERVLFDEAVAFADVLRRQLPEVDHDEPATRQAAYVAAALLYLNLRAGYPALEGGTGACDALGQQAAAWFVSAGGTLPPRPASIERVEKHIVLRGAEIAQRLLDSFPGLVSESGVDRRQGCFAASLLTVRLRAGDVGPFVAAVDAANTYLQSNWESA